jgi:hypothetical protein
MFWVGEVGRWTPASEPGVKERNPLKDGNDKNEKSDAIPRLNGIELSPG